MASTLQITAGLDTSRIFSQVEDVQRRLNSKKINIQINDRASSALGNITGKTTKFNDALDAATARVVAFGVAAGAFNLVRKGVEELLRATVEVESALTRININLNESSEGLKQFSKNIFDIARNTGQTFETAAKAAEELTRQGLSAEETTKRLRDALILSRLAAIDSDEAVKSLTASINSFSKEALSSSEILNKLAAVDAKFAVSTNDLAQAVSRVGSSASDAGVKFDELLAIVTSVQQTTARGGAVIGNAFKTIFTRIERSDTLDDLEALGIGVRDLEGKTLPAIQVLTNLAKTYDTLSQAQRSAVAEQVGGVFQINILKAALGDLGKEYSVYQRALETASGASDEANRKNEALNKTLASSFNELRQSLTQLFAEFGKINLNPVLKAITDGLTGVSKFLAGSDIGKDAGKSLGENIMQGIGNVLTGPGVVALAAIIQSVMSTLIKKVGAEFGQAVSASLLGSGALTGIGQAGKIAQVRRVVPRAASGLLPSIMGESAAISAGVGGASPSAKPVVIPNFNFGGGKRGAVVANTSEYIVPNYAGSGGSAIFNKNMVSAYGLPSNAQRLAQGYIPNFASIKSRKKSDIVDDVRILETENGSSLTYFLDKKTGKINIDYLESKQKGEAFQLFNALGKRSRKLGAPIYTSSFDPQERQVSKDASNYDNLLTIYPQLRYREQSGLKTKGTLFDIDPANYAEGAKESSFRSLSALKSKINSMRPGDFIKKLVNDRIRISDVETSFAAGGFIPNFAGSQANYFRKYFGLGNSPLASAVNREIDAGVSPGNIYIDADKRVASRGNPLGLLVANRRDEPSGGFQGVNRVLAQGGNPKMAGLAGGYVPNFATISPDRPNTFSREQFSGLRGSGGQFLKVSDYTLKKLNDLFNQMGKVNGEKLKAVVGDIVKIEQRLGAGTAGTAGSLVRGVRLSRQKGQRNLASEAEGIPFEDIDGPQGRGFYPPGPAQGFLKAKERPFDVRADPRDAAARDEKATMLRQARRERETRKQQRASNALLGLSIVSSFAAPTIESGINFAFGSSGGGTSGGIVGGLAGGALQGAGIGAIFGPAGAGIGAALGGLAGAFNKLTKSAEEFDEELAKTTAKQVKNASAAAEYIQAEEELNTATSRGERGAVIKRLQDRLNKSLENVDGDTAKKLASAKTPEQKREVLREIDQSLANQISKDEAKSALFRVSNPSILPDFSGKKNAGLVEAGIQIAKNQESRKALLSLSRDDRSFLINEIGRGVSTSESFGLEETENNRKRISRLQSIVNEVGKTDETFRGQTVTEGNYEELVVALTAAAGKSAQLEKTLSENNKIQEENQAFFSKLGVISNFLKTSFETREIAKEGIRERRGAFEQTRLSILEPTLTSNDFAKIKLQSELETEKQRAADARDSLKGQFSTKIRDEILSSGGVSGIAGEKLFAQNDVEGLAGILTKTDPTKAQESLFQFYNEIKKGEAITNEAIKSIEQKNALERIASNFQRRRSAFLDAPSLGGTESLEKFRVANISRISNEGDPLINKINKNEAFFGLATELQGLAGGSLKDTGLQTLLEESRLRKQQGGIANIAANFLGQATENPNAYKTYAGAPLGADILQRGLSRQADVFANIDPKRAALARELSAQLNEQTKRKPDDEKKELEALIAKQKENIDALAKTSVSINTVVDGTVKVISDSLSEGQSKEVALKISEAVKLVLDKTYATTDAIIAKVNGAPLPPANTSKSNSQMTNRGVSQNALNLLGEK